MRDKVDTFHLGYVDDPLPGHDMYRGMLSIPYLRPTFDDELYVASLRFRCLEDHEHQYHGKYNTVAGDRPRLYNTSALLTANDYIAICEGEIDTITAELCGVPAVGVPGVQMWKSHFRAPFLGYETVYIFADGDEPGMRFATTLAQSLTNAKIMPCPPGEDVNAIVTKRGPSALTERIK